MLRELLLGCGAISSALYLLTIDVGAALRYPAYHAYTSHMVSELIAVGAPTRPLMIASGAASSGLIFAPPRGARISAPGLHSLGLTSAAFDGYRVMVATGLFMSPRQIPRKADKPRDLQHGVAPFVKS